MQFDSLKVDEDISIHVQGPEEPIVYWNKRRSSGWKGGVEPRRGDNYCEERCSGDFVAYSVSIMCARSLIRLFTIRAASGKASGKGMKTAMEMMSSKSFAFKLPRICLRRFIIAAYPACRIKQG